jgi:glucose-6-phosphate 1-dehydrogenase
MREGKLLDAGYEQRATAFIVQGATGDLARRPVTPVFAALLRAGLLPRRRTFVGSGRRAMSGDAYRELVLAGLQEFGGDLSDDVLDELVSGLRFAGGASPWVIQVS